MWEKVSSRCHKPLKIFPFGPNGDEVMLYGTVDYGLKDGKNASVDWAARAHLVQEEGTVKMDFYQVYLVSLHVSCHNEIPSLCNPPAHWLFMFCASQVFVLGFVIVLGVQSSRKASDRLLPLTGSPRVYLPCTRRSSAQEYHPAYG